MTSPTLLMLAAAFLITSTLYITLSANSRKVLLKRLALRGRRASTATTPPRSLSPTKADTKEPFYIDVFPPQCRELLGSLFSAIPDSTPSDTDVSTAFRHSEPTTRKQLPWTTPLHSCDDCSYSPTGFTAIEVKSLLNAYPDYSVLTGVPHPTLYANFDIEKAVARPYRPLRWPYHQTMSLTRLEPDWWLEVEQTYTRRISQRQDIYTQHGEKVLQCLPGSEHACREIMQMALQFYVKRYPLLFSLSADRSIFYNSVLQTETRLTDIEGRAALEVLLNNVPEDFAVMLRNPNDGFYYMRAGLICSALGWSVGTKIGKQLRDIHGPVPDYKEKMQFSMDRYFAKLPTTAPIQRGSWGLEVDSPLFMPPGDPHEAHRTTQSPALPLSRVNLRVDWQTLRRLPLSGAIVFNFKALFTPVEAFRSEPGVPGVCLKVLDEGKESLLRYKGSWHVEHVVKPALREWVCEQEEHGLVEDGAEVRTLEHAPFFAGWEERWHAQQGF